MARRDWEEEIIEDKEAIKRGLKDLLRSLSRLESAVIAKVGVILVVLVVIGVGIHLLSGLSAPELEAKVLANTSNKVGSFVLINNLGSSDWKVVKITLNGRYTYQVDRIEAGGKLTIMVESFTENGKAAPRNLIPQVLIIECDKGESVFPLN